MQRRTASRTGASSSRRPPSPLPDVEEEEEGEDVIYSCAPEVASTLDELKLKTLVDRYQIPKEFKPRLPNEGEWCCSPSSGLGVYTSYLLAGLRFPLNSFCRALLHRLCHAPNPILGFVTMTGVLISSLNLILTRTNLTFNKSFTEAFLFL